MRFAQLFERIYVINLEHRVDRRRQVADELDRVGIGFGNVEVFTARKPEDPDAFADIGTRGCYESHLAVLRRAQQDGVRSVLVLEDDIVFSPQFSRDEEELSTELSRMEWDLVHFSYSPEQIANAGGEGRTELYPFFRDVIWTTCYGIHGRSLGRLVEFLEVLRGRPPGHYAGGPMPFDGALNVFRWQYPDIVRLLAIPSIAGQRSSRSDVHPQLRWYDRTPIVRSLAGLAREFDLAAVARRCRGS